ncbi:DUF333 domain-containing protein [Candidatus Woesearchaeota archaeon]|nr:DUF333 domain-containing protein [Candidatus Woesearchaeota archaeon]
MRWLILLLVCAAFVMGCSEPQKYMLDEQGQKQESIKERTGVANPATLYCMNTTGAAWSVKDSSAGEYGICTFSDGSWCEEWAYYNGYCAPGDWMTMCGDQFSRKSTCPPDYNPVCGWLNSTDTWKTFNNACKACLPSEGGAVGYVLGKC